MMPFVLLQMVSACVILVKGEYELTSQLGLLGFLLIDALGEDCGIFVLHFHVSLPFLLKTRKVDSQRHPCWP